MSIYKLKNKSGGSLEKFGYTFSNDEVKDLIDDLGMEVYDILGSKGGENFEELRSLVTGGDWSINDGDDDLSVTEAIHLIKWGAPRKIHTVRDFAAEQTGVAFESHNFCDPSEWTVSEEDSTWTLTPDPGKVLRLTGSKVMFDRRFEASDGVFFKVWMDYEVAPGVIQNIPVKVDAYPDMYRLLLGSRNSYVTPQIGSPASKGAVELVHIPYKYVEPINLYSSLNMRLEIYFENHQIPDHGDYLRLRVEAISESEL